MFNSRKLNSRINKLHERTLRILYQDYVYSFIELLEKDKSTTITIIDNQLPATELFKVKNGLSPAFMNEISKRNKVKTVYNGTKTLNFFGPRIWEIVPNYIKK